MPIELDEVEIAVGDLEIGMYVTRLDCPWTDTDFLLQGFLITGQEEIDALMAQCKYVYIEAKRKITNERRNSSSDDQQKDRRKKPQGLAARALSSSAQIKSRNADSKSKIDPQDMVGQVTYINKVPVEQEFNSAKKTYGFAKLTAKSIMDGIRIGRVIDVQQCRETVDAIVDSILRNVNALTWLTKIKNKDEYTAEHSLNVCILSVTFARHLGLPEDEIRKVGFCGLLHDVGKAKIPLEILNKPGRFTDEELDIMKQHPLYGRDLLVSMKEVDLAAVDVAYCHHERIDENGYPRRLKQHQIPFFAKLIAVTDTYDAITSTRVYDKERSSMDALDIIYKNRGRQFDEDLALEFIKCIGIYPPGAIVEMTNAEVGIVIASNKENKLRPKIILLLDSDKKKMKQKIVDLKENAKDSEGQPYLIACEHPNGKFGIDIKKLTERGLVLKNEQ